jgi:hypothetical protein
LDSCYDHLILNPNPMLESTTDLITNLITRWKVASKLELQFLDLSTKGGKSLIYVGHICYLIIHGSLNVCF